MNGTWLTPSEVEALPGKRGRKWRQSLLHLDKPLSVYNLSRCPDSAGGSSRCSSPSELSATLVPESVVLSRGQDKSMPACSQDTSMSVPYSGVLPPNQSPQASCPLLMNAALSFIKAYRLKGDNVSLKKSACDHFSPEDVELAKKVLWDHCKHYLEAAGLVYHIRRGSDRHSQISATLDDIIQTFLVLDSDSFNLL